MAEPRRTSRFCSSGIDLFTIRDRAVSRRGSVVVEERPPLLTMRKLGGLAVLTGIDLQAVGGVVAPLAFL